MIIEYDLSQISISQAELAADYKPDMEGECDCKSAQGRIDLIFKEEAIEPVAPTIIHALETIH